MKNKIKSLSIRKFDYIINENGNPELPIEGALYSQAKYD